MKKLTIVLFFLFSFHSWSQIRDRASFNFQQLSSRSGERNLSDAWLSTRSALDKDGLTMLQVGFQARRTELPIGFIENNEH